MKNQKAFDCVEYKREIQEKHAAENAGLSGEEKINRRREWLEKSDNPAAVAWRLLKEKQSAEII